MRLIIIIALTLLFTVSAYADCKPAWSSYCTGNYGSGSSGGGGATGVYVVPPPPGWNVNSVYIPSWDTQWQINYQRYLLRQAQRPTKGQSFRQTIPKSARFRK